MSIKFAVKYNGKKKVFTADSKNFENLLSFTKKTWDIDDDIKLEYIFSNEEVEIKKIKSFFDQDTFAFFYENHKNLKGEGKQIGLEVKTVTEFPEYNQNQLNYSEMIIEIMEEYRIKFKDEINKKITYAFLKELEKNYQKEKPKKLEDIHQNILCRNCFQIGLKGARYVCSECENFSLCQKCYKLHSQHFLIKINQPINEEINQYHSWMIENEVCKRLSIQENEEIEVNVYNDGKVKWDKCFLLPVCYSEGFVIGQKVEVGKIDVNQCFNGKIKLQITKEGNYETKWRMFTEKGIPFGQVFHAYITVD